MTTDAYQEEGEGFFFFFDNVGMIAMFADEDLWYSMSELPY